MRRPNSMPLIAVALLLFLSACVNAPPRSGAVLREVADASRLFPSRPAPSRPAQRSFAPACGTPTDEAKIKRIESELIAAIVADVPPDTLATEWERLQAATIACRRRA